MRFRKLSPLAMLAVLAAAAPLWSAIPARKAPPAAAAKAPAPRERAVKTQGEAVIGGQTLHYTATAGTLLLYGPKHQPTASVFYIAYTENGANPVQRPLTFAYNGGPGGASALVDVGGFGPRRIVWPGVNQIAQELPPYQIVNNPDSIFSATDLVFIDAVGTGYSRILKAGNPKMFYGVRQDGQAFKQFIERYISVNRRWNSPKFLLGESYGTTRNAVTANDLVSDGVYLNGVIMCSTVLQFPTIWGASGDDLPFDLYLPSYAAAAYEHHRLNPRPASLQAAVNAAEQYAKGEYWLALYQGDRISPARKQAVAQRLAQLTGIPVALWLKVNLRLPLSVFMRRLMGPDGPMIGRYDARFMTPEMQPLMPFSTGGASGASTTKIWGALTASFNDYLENTLHYTSTRPYTQLSFVVNRDWAFNYPGRMGDTVGPAMARAMNNDPGMQLMMNNGYYDMATPFYATRYSIAHMGLVPSLEKNVHWYYYPVGHMLYVNPKALPALAKNIDAFIAHADAK